MKRYDDALVDFDRAIELNHSNGRVLGSRSLTYWLMERYNDALVDFDRVVELDPANDRVLTQREETYRVMGWSTVEPSASSRPRASRRQIYR